MEIIIQLIFIGFFDFLFQHPLVRKLAPYAKYLKKYKEYPKNSFTLWKYSLFAYQWTTFLFENQKFTFLILSPSRHTVRRGEFVQDNVVHGKLISHKSRDQRLAGALVIFSIQDDQLEHKI